MAFMKLYAANEGDWVTIMDWLIARLYEKEEVSLLDLLNFTIEYTNKLVIEDDDVFSYWEIGWNVLDLNKLHRLKSEIPSDFELPCPKLHFMKRYTN